MRKMKSRRKARSAHLRSTQFVARENSSTAAAADQKQVRGVKLKTVSMWTMLFALLCLAAFVAGRPPVSAAGPSAPAIKERSCLTARRECSRGQSRSARSRHRAASEAQIFRGR